jgi:hypothetical protein
MPAAMRVKKLARNRALCPLLIVGGGELLIVLPGSECEVLKPRP